jgi:hypothetical protein
MNPSGETSRDSGRDQQDIQNTLHIYLFTYCQAHHSKHVSSKRERCTDLLGGGRQDVAVAVWTLVQKDTARNLLQQGKQCFWLGEAARRLSRKRGTHFGGSKLLEMRAVPAGYPAQRPKIGS